MDIVCYWPKFKLNISSSFYIRSKLDIENCSSGIPQHHVTECTGVAPVNQVSCGKEGKKEMFYLTTDSTHFIYGYMVSDI